MKKMRISKKKAIPRVLMLAAALLGGCGGATVQGKQTVKAEAQAEEAVPDEGPITWHHDDYDGALAAAKNENKPLVIDVWAPWCHTCLSMKHYVLVDPSMASLADRFVWLALDSDKPSSAAVLDKFPVHSWPTFFVISPVDESVQARFQGSATIEQFRAFLTQGEQGHLDARAAEGSLAEEDPLRLVRKGDRAAVSEDFVGADKAYGAALAAAPADWQRKPDVLVSQIAARLNTENWQSCVSLALEAMDRTGNSASASDFLAYGSMCTERLEKSDPHKKAFLERATTRLETLTSDANAPLSVDDRSDALRILREAQEMRGDKEAAKKTAESQRALLDNAASNAPNPEAAATYNWPRAEVYIYLDRGAELIPALEDSTKALPKDYDPPYRLAWVALQIGSLEKALDAAKKSLALVYGPRKGRVLEMIVEIHKASGDWENELKTLRNVVAHYESLPKGQKRPRALDRAKAALAKPQEPVSK